MDYVHQLEARVNHGLDLVLELLYLFLVSLVETLDGPGVQPLWGLRREGRDILLVPRWCVGQVEPLLLPEFHGLNKCPLWPGDLGDLADHGPATICKFGATAMRHDAKYL